MNRIRFDPSFSRLKFYLNRLLSCMSVSDAEDCLSSAVSDPDLSVHDYVVLVFVHLNFFISMEV